jgi:membrane peptidoglycan carboxypeptidase
MGLPVHLAMAIRTNVSKYFSLRRTLIQIHLDLFKIEHHIKYDRWWPEPLNDFEILVLILEDRRFFHHYGTDILSILREIARALTFRRFGGASTIDMQLVRTATGYRQIRLRRKLYEMLLAWIIQYRYNKFEILRSYLGCAFFGSHLIGSERAATQIYSVPSSMLTFDQAAELAAMLVYPRPLVPSSEWVIKVRRRADYAKRLYPRLKQRFEKLPSPEFL